MKKIRNVLYIFGDVSGVGFRANVKNEINVKYPNITGYAKNLPNSRVEVVLEGEWIQVVKLSGWIRCWPGVLGTEIKSGKYTGEYRDFQTK